ncbi:hypothetical protein KEM55_002702 [Ascosphaera atra]|nr:hypothetical protein KEM55_002702 [Ascosphaera atra]
MVLLVGELEPQAFATCFDLGVPRPPYIELKLMGVLYCNPPGLLEEGDGQYKSYLFDRKCDYLYQDNRKSVAKTIKFNAFPFVLYGSSKIAAVAVDFHSSDYKHWEYRSQADPGNKTYTDWACDKKGHGGKMECRTTVDCLRSTI